LTFFLEGYAYHSTLGADVFVITIVAVIVIALITVIYQVTKAAIVNPATILRSE
jgi:ABC-type antimicrobial peptide transport system permease subunit